MTDLPKVRVTHRFTASAERVFDAWLDPTRLGRWLFQTPTGEMVRVEVDARVGGRWVVTERRDGEDVEHTGEYLVIERPRRLVFTLRVPKYSQDVDEVTVEITPLARGCELTLTHAIDPKWKEHTRQIESGWAQCLDGLAATLGLFVEAAIDIRAPATRVWDVLTRPERSREWIRTWWPDLDRVDADWTPGGHVRWRLADGTVAADGVVATAHAGDALRYTFSASPGKEEMIAYRLQEHDGVTRLVVSVGDFGDTDEHRACHPGAVEAWRRSLPAIRQLAER